MGNNIKLTLDGSDKIVGVEGDWDSFASENGGDCFAEKVLGKSIWDSISGHETKDQLSKIFDYSRENQRLYKLWYRCDAPGMPRLHLMEVRPSKAGPGELQVLHSQHSVFPEKPAVLKGESSGEAVLRCSFCCRYKEAEEWVNSYKLSRPDIAEEIHVVCPDCTAENQAAIKRSETEPGPVVSNLDHAFEDLSRELKKARKP